MALPDVIEIVPWGEPPTARITAPGSKSITNRALILAALESGRTVLRSALWSDDTEVMVGGLGRLGIAIEVAPDPGEGDNRHLAVAGGGGRIGPGGTRARPLELFVGNAGTAARFLAALVCLGEGVYRLHGAPRMHERPQSGLFAALRQLGYRVECEAAPDHLPALVHGGGPRPGAAAEVDVASSSQFASALLLCAPSGGWQIGVAGDERSPYIDMTRRQRAAFPPGGGQVAIEPDASNGSYFWAADALEPAADGQLRLRGNITVANWPDSGWQIDADFPHYLPLPPALSRRDHLGDSILTAMVLAPLGPRPVAFTELGRLRVQECERVQAMRQELTRCGAEVVEEGDALTIAPSRLHGATIQTYDDHRVAMSFAVLGLKVPGIRIANPGCVAKTFPLFFDKLAAPPPDGLGVEIRDGNGGPT